MSIAPIDWRRAASSRKRAVVVDVGDGDRRMLGPQNGDELGGRERRAAEREEIAVGVDRDRAELLAPADGELALGRRQVGVTGPSASAPVPGGGHGSAFRSTLPEVATGSSSSTTISGTRLAGIRSATSARTSWASTSPAT